MSMPAAALDALSVIARQCIALTCLARFCRRHQITHPALQAFIEHAWKIAQLGPQDFASWERGFAALAVTGLGDAWPDEVKSSIPHAMLGTLTTLVEHVLETSASTWHGENLIASRQQLEAVLRICGEHGVPTPALQRYRQGAARLRAGWGPPLSAGELLAWRSWV
jgi:hypothetical protein